MLPWACIEGSRYCRGCYREIPSALLCHSSAVSAADEVFHLCLICKVKELRTLDYVAAVYPSTSARELHQMMRQGYRQRNNIPVDRDRIIDMSRFIAHEIADTGRKTIELSE